MATDSDRTVAIFQGNPTSSSLAIGKSFLFTVVSGMDTQAVGELPCLQQMPRSGRRKSLGTNPVIARLCDAFVLRVGAYWSSGNANSGILIAFIGDYRTFSILTGIRAVNSRKPGVPADKSVIKGICLAVEFLVELLAENGSQEQIVSNYAVEASKQEHVCPLPV